MADYNFTYIKDNEEINQFFSKKYSITPDNVFVFLINDYYRKDLAYAESNSLVIVGNTIVKYRQEERGERASFSFIKGKWETNYVEKIDWEIKNVDDLSKIDIVLKFSSFDGSTPIDSVNINFDLRFNNFEYNFVTDRDWRNKEWLKKYSDFFQIEDDENQINESTSIEKFEYQMGMNRIISTNWMYYERILNYFGENGSQFFTFLTKEEQIQFTRFDYIKITEVRKWLDDKINKHCGFFEYRLNENGKFISIKISDYTPIDLTILKKIDFLEELEISFTKAFTDLSPIYHLTMLKSLVIEGYIESVHFLKEFQQLETLKINKNLSVLELNILGNIPTLKRLSVFSAKITNLDWLVNSEKLEKLEFQGDSLMDLSGLGYLKNLKSLILNDCYNLNSFCTIKEATSIKILRLNNIGTKYKNASEITEEILLNPEILSKYCVDLSSLSYLINLEEINIGTIQINDILFIDNLKKLKIIRLHSDFIEDITPLCNLPEVEELDIYLCDRIKIYQKLNMPNLKILALPQNINNEILGVSDNVVVIKGDGDIDRRL